MLRLNTVNLYVSKSLSLLGVVMLFAIGCETTSSGGQSDLNYLDQEIVDQQSAPDQNIDFDTEVIPEMSVPTDMSMSDDGSSMDSSQGGSEPDLMPPPWTPPVGERSGHFIVRVLLDYEPVEGALITQGGAGGRWITDEKGEAWVELDTEAARPLMLFAAHEAARTRGEEVSADRVEGLTLTLTRFATPDHPGYSYSDPGEPTRRSTTAQCGHCHLDLNDAWFESPHRSSAKNPIVYDLYTGRGSGWQNEDDCQQAGGRWRIGPVEGGGEAREQCYFDISALGAFNEACRETPCDPQDLRGEAYYGGCADCHAPAVDGLQGGGHDLLSVRDRAFEDGVSCDLCHHVERINQDAPAGVGGRLVIHRPSESANFTLGGGGYLPLSFGPHADVANPRMGISPRAHYRDGTLCGGCHQHDHDDVHALSPVDRSRWPQGLIPNQSTFQEWKEGPFGSTHGEPVACNDCHMPPLANVMNGANLETFAEADLGIQGGWPRPYGEVRAHAWWGPRQPKSPILSLSAGVSIGQMEVSEEEQGARSLSFQVQVTNLGAGHGLPTGEPMRHLILVVEAQCDEINLRATGGDAVHSVGGSLSRQLRGDWVGRWPLAEVGDYLRVVRQIEGEEYDYDGYGSFRDPMHDEERNLAHLPVFSVADKGLIREDIIGEALITGVSEDGTPTLDQPLPGSPGDIVYLTRDRVGEPSSFAGRSGFTFARVLKDQSGREMVPHFIAYDLVRDNRLRPGDHWQTSHQFELPEQCENPVVSARLVYRPYPLWLAQERGWTMWDRIIRKVQKSFVTPDRPSIPPAGVRLAVSHGDVTAALEIPNEWVEVGIEQWPAWGVTLSETAAEQATRQGVAWPWMLHSITGGELDEGRTTSTQLSGPMRIYNLSALPLAIEPIEGVDLIGGLIDDRPPVEVERTSTSLVPSVWIIPPGAGAAFIPRRALDHDPLVSIGYTPLGGRSWTPLTPLGEWSVTEEQYTAFAQLNPSPTLRISSVYGDRETYFTDPDRGELRWSYQGSSRGERWWIAGDSPLIEAGQPTRIELRNVTPRDLPFSIEHGPHWIWKEESGWYGPYAVTWIPSHGSLTIGIPGYQAGTRQIGALTTVGPRTSWQVE